ncbi:heparinase II/III family protein [Acetobacter suratthaniensis]|uniref:Heparinase II/III family protein n=1 Tax=Acetobacter suratthaniensis TaxID=1502841 RepID=A0ABS3LHR0_9PROT|nr:heparinase II/III family protein [Acetobacter suratthaniensis]MBO1327139.1 heparinase II/III family protein [Acetobacter suratthaniensis]MCX2565249.1 heparinase II/III family protein [Acetobacter suratthaniensis]
MSLRRWTQGTRLSYALRNPRSGFGRVPDAPAMMLRDLWPGDALAGERLVRNQTSHDGISRQLQPGQWDAPDWSQAYCRWLQGFTWLRDLRELGAESARIRARTLVSHWMRIPPMERPLSDPAITGMRLASWLGCYEFFAASADDRFRQNLMTALIMEARSIAALMPEALSDWRALSALKGLLAVGVVMPDYPEFLERFLRLLDGVLAGQFHPDGSHVSRSPEVQFQSVRELAEMLSIFQTARHPQPTALLDAANRAAPVLRAMRHGDGRLALFNGSLERDANFMELVLNRACRTRVVAASVYDSGFTRMTSGRAMLLADSAAPPPQSETAHAGMLSFEFSSGKQRLIVNCGSSTRAGWELALRYPAAHSVLEAPGLKPLTFERDGTLSHLPQVNRTHVTHEGAHWLDMSHDGYAHQGGGVYSRKLYLGREGHTLRGEEHFGPCEKPTPSLIRFHLHPSVTLEETPEGLHLNTAEEVWLFQSDAEITVEESVYLGRGAPEPSRQIVLTARTRPAATETTPPTADNDSDSTEGTVAPAPLPDTPDEAYGQAPSATLTENADLATAPVETAGEQPEPASKAEAPSTDIPQRPKLAHTPAAPDVSTTQRLIHWGLTLIET